MAIFLNLLASFSIAFFIANLVVSLIVSILGEKLLLVALKPRKAVLWLIVLLPWLMGFIVCLYLIDVYFYLTLTLLQTERFAHWHHISDFSWSNWHGVTLILMILYVVYVIFRQLKLLLQHRSEIKLLTAFSKEIENGVFEIETTKITAFTTGVINKKCFVTTGLINKVSKEEFDVILKHEKAHIKNSDPFKKWLFGTLALFFLKPISKLLNLQMALAMEQDADNTVLEDGIDRIFVASTLIKIAKLNADEQLLKSDSMVVNFGADILEQRVYCLLNKLELAPVNKSVTLLVILCLVVISTSSIDGIHHLIETIFAH